MAATLSGRGPDDRRASVLATPETWRERLSAEIPAHRAGRGFQVRGAGLRRTLAYVSAAVTTMVALAFLIPLGLVVQQLARERALADAERQTAVVVAVLTLTTDPLDIERAVASTGGPAVTRVSVHNLGTDGEEIGTGHAKTGDLTRAADQAAPFIADVPGGLSYLEPVDLG